jgi:hypothetical protein
LMLTTLDQGTDAVEVSNNKTQQNGNEDN